ncbi:hypothetical protein [Archaeoglobus sp.]
MMYRDLEEKFLVSGMLKECIRPKRVLHRSTICKAVKMLREDLKRVLEGKSKLLDYKLSCPRM